jgi:hypothetical protein
MINVAMAKPMQGPANRVIIAPSKACLGRVIGCSGVHNTAIPDEITHIPEIAITMMKGIGGLKLRYSSVISMAENTEKTIAEIDQAAKRNDLVGRNTHEANTKAKIIGRITWTKSLPTATCARISISVAHSLKMLQIISVAIWSDAIVHLVNRSGVRTTP